MLSQRAATVATAGRMDEISSLTPLREVEGKQSLGLTDPGGVLAFTWHLHLCCLRNVIFSLKGYLINLVLRVV